MATKMERPTSFHPSNDRISFTINNKNEPVFFFNDLHPLIVEGNFETKKNDVGSSSFTSRKGSTACIPKKKKKTWPFSVEDLPEALGNVNGQVGN